MEFSGVHIHQRRAEAYSVGGAFEEALKHYEMALEEHLEINTLFGYAFTAYQAGFYEKAIEKLESVKELDPEYHSVTFYWPGYEHESALEESLEAVREGQKQDEFNKELSSSGRVALKLGLDADAEELLRNALALDGISGYLEAALVLK